jgi:hypothetical protein
MYLKAFMFKQLHARHTDHVAFNDTRLRRTRKTKRFEGFRIRTDWKGSCDVSNEGNGFQCAGS